MSLLCAFGTMVYSIVAMLIDVVIVVVVTALMFVLLLPAV
jgi:hypothetical protein